MAWRSSTWISDAQPSTERSNAVSIPKIASRPVELVQHPDAMSSENDPVLETDSTSSSVTPANVTALEPARLAPATAGGRPSCLFTTTNPCSGPRAPRGSRDAIGEVVPVGTSQRVDGNGAACHPTNGSAGRSRWSGSGALVRARLLPQVDAALDRVLVDLRQLSRGERQVGERLD